MVRSFCLSIRILSYFSFTTFSFSFYNCFYLILFFLCICNYSRIQSVVCLSCVQEFQESRNGTALVERVLTRVFLFLRVVFCGFDSLEYYEQSKLIILADFCSLSPLFLPTSVFFFPLAVKPATARWRMTTIIGMGHKCTACIGRGRPVFPGRASSIKCTSRFRTC